MRLLRGTVPHLLSACALAASVVVGLPARAQGDKKIAIILPTTGATEGLPPGQIRGAIRGTLAEELRTFTVLTEEEGQALLKRAKELDLNCVANDEECLLKLGILGGTDILISPVVTRDARGQLLTISVFDVEVEKKAGEAARLLESADTAPSLARSAIIELFAPEKFRGRLSINVNDKGAMIRVDDEDVGVAPLPAPLELRAGPHQVEVSAPGKATHQSEVVVPFGKLSSITVDLLPIHAAPANVDDAPMAWAFPVGIGVGAVTALAGTLGLVSGTFFLLQTLDVYVFSPDAEANLAAPLSPKISADTLMAAQIAGWVFVGATAATVVGGAATAGLFLVE